MTLAFSQTLNGKPTNFVNKILQSIPGKATIIFDANFKVINVTPKIHTIREDKKQKWYPGMKIHFVINNRTPQREQFAPVIPCMHTQKISITYWYNKATEKHDLPMVLVDDKELTKKQIETLAINDGFENVADFFAYFNKKFTGKLIHWTDFKY